MEQATGTQISNQAIFDAVKQALDQLGKEKK
jgi:Na+-translocating ferredoxin:NAD+ oxidoreductase RnfG subunit